jgi:HK97 family phage prohead protease
MKPELEKRCFKVELRADAENAAPRITGYAAIYDSPSELLAGSFYERIARGTFDRALERTPDVRLLVNHDPSLILARTKSGTLRLAADDRGLKIEADPPDTQLGRDTLTQLRRGDLDQMSFGFFVRKDAWTEEDVNGRRVPVRTLHDVELDDVSIVTYPAYKATSVEARKTCRNLPLSIARKILELFSKK